MKSKVGYFVSSHATMKTDILLNINPATAI